MTVKGIVYDGEGDVSARICICAFMLSATTLVSSVQSIVHTTKAEDFLRKAIDLPRFAGGAFDFISMCPPYLLVSYPELFDLINRSQLVHKGTLLFVE